MYLWEFDLPIFNETDDQMPLFLKKSDVVFVRDHLLESFRRFDQIFDVLSQWAIWYQTSLSPYEREKPKFWRSNSNQYQRISSSLILNTTVSCEEDSSRVGKLAKSHQFWRKK